MPAVHEARRARLRERLRTEVPDADALLVTSLVNVRYLTGFSGSNGALLVPADAADDDLLATDARYTVQAVDEAGAALPLLVARACAEALAEQASARGLVALAVEGDDLSLNRHARLQRGAQGTRLIPTSGLVERLRAVKDDGELALLAEACAISVAAFDQLVDAGPWEGRTELELAADLEARMRALGAEALAFESIVGGGPHSAVPHHRPTDRPVVRGDLVVLDFGARVQGYHADMTRTVVVGAPAAWHLEIADVVRAAQRVGREAVAAGAECADVDARTRAVVEAAGYGEAFGHGTGHGVGLEIHEAPAIGPGATGRLADRMPVTVEPGVYLPGRGGVRVEDTVVVDGPAPRVLTTTSRELRVLR